MKRCRKCGREKPLDEFHRNHRTKDGMEGACKDCKSAYSRWRNDNREKVRKYIHGRPGSDSWKYSIGKKYGLTVNDYKVMFNTQGGVCAICGCPPKNERLHVDHDHKTGLVRGLLCNACNVALGNARDSISILSKMIEYLKRNSSGRVFFDL